jgi:undecaprenyl-diphosphatase
MTWIERRVFEPMKSLAAFARSEAVMLVGLAVIMATLVLFLDLAEDVGEASHNAFDLQVIQALHAGADPSNPIGPNWFDRAMLDMTSLGSLAVLGTVSLIVTGYLLFQRQALKALALALALGGGLALSETLKTVFERSRPPDIYRAAEALNASFPSGHALMSTVVYLTLGAMLARAATRRRIKSYILGVAIAIALIVGYRGSIWGCTGRAT